MSYLHNPTAADLHRAWHYGDALFETIRCVNGQLQRIDLHIDRLLTGLRLMGFEVPEHWDTAFFTAVIQQFDLQSAPVLRIRLTVWRAPGGLYRPVDNRPFYHIALAPTDAPFCQIALPGISVVVCPTVQLPIDMYAAFKALNAPRYVVAARFAEKEGFDDALLKNAHGRIADATSSTVFWQKNGQLYTTPLSEGCVNGTMSMRLMAIARKWQQPIQEGWLSKEMLPELEGMFLTNAIRGIVRVGRVRWGNTDFTFGQHDALDKHLAQLKAGLT